MDFTLPEIPTPKEDDPEDVSWALSTAEAMWSRGDHAEAIKWIRRGAEAASEAEADDRALELAKAAADLASMIVRMSHSGENTSEEPPPPPPPPGPPGSMRVPPQSVAPPPMATAPSAPPQQAPPSGLPPASNQPMPVTARSVPPPAMAQPQGQRASTAPPSAVPRSVPPPGNSNQAQRAPRPLQASRGPERPVSTGKGVLSSQSGRSESRRRRSNANLDEEARTENGGPEPLADKVERAAREAMRVDFRKTNADLVPPEALQEEAPAPVEAPPREPEEEPRPRSNEPHEPRDEESPPSQDPELARTSELDADGDPTRALTGSLTGNQPPRKKRKGRGGEMRAKTSSATDEWDAHPTQSLSRAELDSITNEHSLDLPRRPANLGEAARARTPSSPPRREEREERKEPQPIVASQAVRVVLWRDADGVHVAPAGTVVSAIKVDAILVALDPTADLSTWLDPRRPR